LRFEEQSVGAFEVAGHRYEVLARWEGTEFQVTFHPVPNRPLIGVPQATLSLDASVSGFRWLIVDDDEFGPSLADFAARIDELGEDARLDWVRAAAEVQIEGAVDMATRLAQSQTDWLARLHRFTLVAAASRWPEPVLRRTLLRMAGQWDGSWDEMLAAARSEPSR
jgi:hypothetical protein